MTLAILAALIGSVAAGAHLSSSAGVLGLPIWPAYSYALLALAAIGAQAWLCQVVDRDPGSLRRCLAYGLVLTIVWLSPWVDRLRLPDPHDLLERKRQLILALPAALLLLAGAVEQALALRRRLQRGRSAALWPMALPLVWLLTASAWTTPWNMTGDAPHYMLIAHSIVQDGDIDIADDFRDGEAVAFYPRMPLLTHDREVDGRIISWHKPGLSYLIAPAYAAGGRTLVVALLCLVAALLAGGVWALLAAAGFSPQAAWWAWAAVVLSPPFFTQGAMVLTELPAALAVTLALWGLLRLERPGAAAVFGFALFCLPWFNSRFFALYPPLTLALLWFGRRNLPGTWPAWAGVVLGVLSSSIYTYAYFGDPSPLGGMKQASLGEADFAHFSLDWGRQALLGQLWDQEFGLGLTASFWLLGLWGAVLALRRGDRLAGLALALFAINYGMLSFWYAWQGQMTPNRFYTPLLPVLALGLAWAAPQGGGNALSWGWRIAALISLTLSWLYTALPWLAFNRGDGVNWLFKLAPGGRALAAVLPSFQDPGPKDWAWGLALSAALGWSLLKTTRTLPKP